MSDDEVVNLSYKEQWLLGARNGDVQLLADIIQHKEDYDVDLNCCGELIIRINNFINYLWLIKSKQALNINVCYIIL